jgi:hypothetical protein
MIDQKRIEVQDHRSKEVRNENFEFGNSLRENMRVLLDQEMRIKNSFIESSDVVGFIQDLEDSAQSYGLKITINSVDEGDSQPLGSGLGKTLPVTLNIQVEGLYVPTRQFVDGLNRFEKRLLISNLSMFRTGPDAYTTRIAIKGIILSYE